MRPGRAGGRRHTAFCHTDTCDVLAPVNGERYVQAFAGPGTTGPITNPNTRDISFFAQDEWRVTSKLTFSYGLRWEFSPAGYEKYDRTSTFSPVTPNPAAGGIPGAIVYAGNCSGCLGRRLQRGMREGDRPPVPSTLQQSARSGRRREHMLRDGIAAALEAHLASAPAAES